MNKQCGGQNNGNHPMRTASWNPNESNIRDLLDNIKHVNLGIIGIPEGEEREKGTENVFEEIMAENLQKKKKETDIKKQVEQRVPTNKIWTQT